MTLNTKCDSMALKYPFFQKITKNRPAAGALPPDTQSDAFELHKLSQHVSEVRYLHFSTISLIPLSLQNPG